MADNMLVATLQNQKTMFLRSTGALDEADSGFAPAEGMFTVAQQVAHVAQSLDWFVDGAFQREDGPNLDFAGADQEIRKISGCRQLPSKHNRNAALIGV